MLVLCSCTIRYVCSALHLGSKPRYHFLTPIMMFNFISIHHSPAWVGSMVLQKSAEIQQIGTWLKNDLLGVPNLLSILLNAAVGAEKSHPRHRSDGLGEPGILILVLLIDHRLRIDVALEVVGDQVVVSMVRDAVDEGTELARVAEHALADDLEDTHELWIELEAAVVVGVA